MSDFGKLLCAALRRREKANPDVGWLFFQQKRDGSRQHPMSLNDCLQAKGDVGSTHLITIQRCGKSTTYSGSPQPKLVEKCIDYDRCKVPTCYVRCLLCSCPRKCSKDKLMNIEWCSNATTNMDIHKKYLMDDTTWRWLMSLGWCTLGSSELAFRSSTFMSPCRCTQVTANACMHWMIFYPISQRLLPKNHKPCLTLLHDRRFQIPPTDSNTPWKTCVEPCRSRISLRNISFHMRTCHVRYVWFLKDIDYHWPMLLAWKVEVSAFGSYHLRTSM